MKQELFNLGLVDLSKLKPITIAQLYYLFCCDFPFEADLADYLLNGVVVARPGLFYMARLADVRPLDADGKPIGAEPEIAWFIRFAAGSLSELVTHPPGQLPKICFYRNKPGKEKNRKLHVWSLNRLIQLGKLETKKATIL